tara:strand:- start:2346 stop:2702 length:357 start_codon:yes stop_codon:yes gene_type:complete
MCYSQSVTTLTPSYMGNNQITNTGIPVEVLWQRFEFIIDGGILSVPVINANDLTLYPNPANETFHLDIKGPYKIIIYNLLGVVVGDSNKISALPVGMYFVRVTLENGSKRIFKLIITH